MLYPPGIFFSSLLANLSTRSTITPHPLTPPTLFYSPPIFTNRTPPTQTPPRRSRSETTDPQVWHIKLHIHFLSPDGNLIDAGCLAGMTALRHFRRPEVERLDRDDGMAAIWKVVSPSLRVSDYKYRVIPRMHILRRLSYGIWPAWRRADFDFSLFQSLRRGHLQYPTDERAPVPLSIHHTPLCVTFAYLEG
jgi:hypothetical protein